MFRGDQGTPRANYLRFFNFGKTVSLLLTHKIKQRQSNAPIVYSSANSKTINKKVPPITAMLGL